MKKQTNFHLVDFFNPYERYKEQENSIHFFVHHPLSHVTTDPEETVTNIPSWDFFC